MVFTFLVKLIPQDLFSIGGFSVKWYAVCILLGALVAFGITRHETRKKGIDPSHIDGLFVFSFIFGIIGARIWYVIASWNDEFANSSNLFMDIISIWNGGLAIQGGAILGIAAGLIYVKLFIKELNPFEALDQVAPTILLAQAIGRIGNFINREVYGKCTSIENYKMFPEWFINQLVYENESGSLICPVGQMAHPLFMWEALANVVGFIVLFFILYKALNK